MKYFTCLFVLSLLHLGCILLSEDIPGPSSHFSRLKAPWCWQLCMGWAGVLGSFLSDGHYYQWSTSPYPQGDGHADMVLCSSEASLDRLHSQSVHGHKWLLSSSPSPDEGSISFLNKPVVQLPWPAWCGSFSMETPTHPSDADQGHLLGTPALPILGRYCAFQNWLSHILTPVFFLWYSEDNPSWEWWVPSVPLNLGQPYWLANR